MNPGVPLAYLQLRKSPRRLGIALAGIVVSAVGILCQMGFEDSLFRSATRLFEELDADIVMLSPQYQFMVLPAQFSERRLYQALSVAGVESIAAMRLGIAPFRNPVSGINRNVYVVGIDPKSGVFANPDWAMRTRALQEPDAVLFDSGSRPEFGDIATLFRSGEVRTEIANQRVRVVGLFEMGASFSADGTVIANTEAFSRLFAKRRTGLIDVGLIRTESGVDVEKVVQKVRAALPQDVSVMTHAQFNAREQRYWRSTTPAGFIFRIVLVVSLLVGCVSVYQILSSDISENLPQYATLKALGYPDSYFLKLTFEKAWLLCSSAYPIAFLLTEFVYLSATHFTLVPLVMTSARVIGVYALLLAASVAAGAIAIQRLRRQDLSELF